MKCLSVRQPWAWAIINAGKTIENRTWKTNFRGRVAIQAGKACTEEEYEDGAHLIKKLTGRRPPPLDKLAKGVIIGTVEITDCAPATHGKGWGCLNPCGYHWLLAAPRRAKHRKVRGWPGLLFEVGTVADEGKAGAA